MMKTPRWKLFIVSHTVVALIGASYPFYLYWKERNKPPVVETRVEVQVQEKIVEVVKWKTRDRIIEKKVERPDGTKVTTVVKEEAKEQTNTVEQKKEEKIDVSAAISKEPPPRYGLGVMTDIRNTLSGLGTYSLTDNIDVVVSATVKLKPLSIPRFGVGVVVRF